jgi:hypothetical protein
MILSILRERETTYPPLDSTYAATVFLALEYEVFPPVRRAIAAPNSLNLALGYNLLI